MTTQPISWEQEKAEMQRQIDLLMKVADKGRLGRFMDPTKYGKSVKVSLYREDASEEPRLIVSWKMIKDFVRTDKRGVQEEQIVEITLENNGKIDAVEQKLSEISDPSKLEEGRKKLEILKGMYVKRMAYIDFGVYIIEKQEVNVKQTITEGDQIFFVIDWNDKEYKMPIQFIN